MMKTGMAFGILVFLERKQAEAISYYPDKIQLREDCDLEINWKE